ncbi:hypothetical protein BKN38_02670 [Helicobacter sp. CLO-3]|nr:hypothetical protein BKN38_02670 [Helicobacter sp. CLO-3]
MHFFGNFLAFFFFLILCVLDSGSDLAKCQINWQTTDKMASKDLIPANLKMFIPILLTPVLQAFLSLAPESQNSHKMIKTFIKSIYK